MPCPSRSRSSPSRRRRLAGTRDMTNERPVTPAPRFLLPLSGPAGMPHLPQHSTDCRHHTHTFCLPLSLRTDTARAPPPLRLPARSLRRASAPLSTFCVSLGPGVTGFTPRSISPRPAPMDPAHATPQWSLRPYDTLFTCPLLRCCPPLALATSSSLLRIFSSRVLVLDGLVYPRLFLSFFCALCESWLFMSNMVPRGLRHRSLECERVGAGRSLGRPSACMAVGVGIAANQGTPRWVMGIDAPPHAAAGGAQLSSAVCAMTGS